MSNIIHLPTSEEAKKTGAFSDTLKCRVSRVVFRKEAVHVYFPDGDCCDFTGVTTAIEALLPCVKIIITYSGSKSDTIYAKQDGKWKAVPRWRYGQHVTRSWCPADLS